MGAQGVQAQVDQAQVDQAQVVPVQVVQAQVVQAQVVQAQVVQARVDQALVQAHGHQQLEDQEGLICISRTSRNSINNLEIRMLNSKYKLSYFILISTQKKTFKKYKK